MRPATNVRNKTALLSIFFSRGSARLHLEPNTRHPSLSVTVLRGYASSAALAKRVWNLLIPHINASPRLAETGGAVDCHSHCSPKVIGTWTRAGIVAQCTLHRALELTQSNRYSLLRSHKASRGGKGKDTCMGTRRAASCHSCIASGTRLGRPHFYFSFSPPKLYLSPNRAGPSRS